MLVGRYRTILFSQYLLLLVDLVLNSFTEMMRYENIILLILYVIQDICILFNVIIVFLLFFNTYIFQAGLVNILVNKFRLPICITFIYFIMSIALHVYGMTRRWDDPDKYIWDVTGYRALFVIQRIMAILYYYFYKRTALKLGDPRFYQDSDWIRREFERRR